MNVRKTIAGIGIAGALTLGASVVVPEAQLAIERANTPEHLKLKVPTEEIFVSRVVRRDFVDESTGEIDVSKRQEYVSYRYKTDKEVPPFENEVVEMRTGRTYTQFLGQDKGSKDELKFAQTSTLGQSMIQDADTGKWFEIGYSTTTPHIFERDAKNTKLLSGVLYDVAYAASTTFNFGGTFDNWNNAEDSGCANATDWTNISNAGADDAAYAVWGNSGSQTNCGVATNFGFSVPSGAPLTGFEMQYEGFENSSGNCSTGGILLITASSTSGTSFSDSYGGWTTSPEVRTSGGDGVTNGNDSLTGSDANADNFGYTFAMTKASFCDFSLDYLQLKVYYSLIGVSTDFATNVKKTSATINGELTFADEASDIGFEYGLLGGFTATTTVETATSSIGTFSDSLTSLSSFSEYQYRAYASSTVSDTFQYGATYFFFTADISTSSPVTAAHAAVSDWDTSVLADGTLSTTTTSGDDIILEIQELSTPSIRSDNSGTGTTDAGGVCTVTAPATISTGDWLFLVIAKDDDFSFSTFSGWTSLDNEVGNSGNDISLGFFKKEVTDGAAEQSTTYDFDSNDASEECSWYIAAVQDTNGDSEDSELDYRVNDSTPQADGFTTNRKHLTFAFWYVDTDTAVTPPTSPWTTEVDDLGASNSMVVSSRTGVASEFTSVELTGVGSTDETFTAQFAFYSDQQYEEGYWISPSWDVGTITDVDTSWVDVSSTTPSDTSLEIAVALNTSSTTAPAIGDFSTTTNQSAMSGVTGDLSGKYLWTLVWFNPSSDNADTPTFSAITWGITQSEGGGETPTGDRKRGIIISLREEDF